MKTGQHQTQWKQQEKQTRYRHFFKLFANILSYLSVLKQNEKLKFLWQGQARLRACLL